jgi:hypothetical protein
MFLQVGILPDLASVAARCVARHASSWHRSNSKGSSGRVNRLNVPLPGSEAVFSIVEDLTASLGAFEGFMDISWDDRGVIKEIEHASTLLGEHYLLLSTLDGSGRLDVESLLKLLASLDVESAEAIRSFSLHIQYW